MLVINDFRIKAEVLSFGFYYLLYVYLRSNYYKTIGILNKKGITQLKLFFYSSEFTIFAYII
jgi:hypothetical protein